MWKELKKQNKVEGIVKDHVSPSNIKGKSGCSQKAQYPILLLSWKQLLLAFLRWQIGDIFSTFR